MSKYLVESTKKNFLAVAKYLSIILAPNLIMRIIHWWIELFIRASNFVAIIFFAALDYVAQIIGNFN